MWLSRGVDAAWFEVCDFRPASAKTYALHLQLVETDDIHWLTSAETQDATWKNGSSDGVADAISGHC